MLGKNKERKTMEQKVDLENMAYDLMKSGLN
jgi:hypothetical protein